jgi:hypothetical protein
VQAPTVLLMLAQSAFAKDESAQGNDPHAPHAFGHVDCISFGFDEHCAGIASGQKRNGPSDAPAAQQTTGEATMQLGQGGGGRAFVSPNAPGPYLPKSCTAYRG